MFSIPMRSKETASVIEIYARLSTEILKVVLLNGTALLLNADKCSINFYYNENVIF